MTTRRAVTTLLCSGLLFLLVGSAGVAQEAPLRLGHSHWVGYGPFFVAEEQGYFDEEGVDVELVTLDNPKVRFAALTAEKIDALATTIDTMPLYLKPDFRMQYLFCLDDSTGGDGIVADQSIESVEGLKGKKVAYNEGTTSDFYLNYVLREAGLSIDELEGVNMTQSDAGSAFMTERVDAAVTWEPWLSRAKQSEHGHVLVDSSSSPGLITDCVMASTETAQNRLDEFAAMYRAWNRAMEFVRANPKEANKIMAEGVGGWLDDPDVFAETLEGVTFYDKERNEEFFGSPDNPGKIYDTLGAALEIWSDAGRLQVQPKKTELINHKVVAR